MEIDDAGGRSGPEECMSARKIVGDLTGTDLDAVPRSVGVTLDKA